MSLAVIDARQWQNVYDLRTGRKSSEDGPAIQLLKETLERHPYPGDVEAHGDQWVTDTALDLIGTYEPRLACLFYARAFFASRYTAMTDQERARMLQDVFREVDRFVERSGYTPVIVGSGDMTALRGLIDLSKLDGLAISSHWSARYAGLHQPSRNDLDLVRGHPRIERVVAREEWRALFPGAPGDPSRIPDYLLVAEEGWTFRAAGTPLRKTMRLQGSSPMIPVATPLGEPRVITEIRSLIEDHLEHTKIALIIVEGVGVKDFPKAHTPCVNAVGWYYYEPGDAQYLTLMTGAHQVFAYPTGYRYLEEVDENPDYPYSGYFTHIPEGTLGADFQGRSFAVGNRSMLTHMVFGTDISIECFARNLYNQGCMGVVHRVKEPRT
jgi:hypothetical protein